MVHWNFFCCLFIAKSFTSYKWCINYMFAYFYLKIISLQIYILITLMVIKSNKHWFRNNDNKVTRKKSPITEYKSDIKKKNSPHYYDEIWYCLVKPQLTVSIENHQPTLVTQNFSFKAKFCKERNRENMTLPHSWHVVPTNDQRVFFAII